MRDFGASRDERRPDVRFCGLGAAVEEWARADWRSVNGMVGDLPIMSREAIVCSDGERAGSGLLPHGLSMMLGHGAAQPASALDRDAVAKQVAVIPLRKNGHQQQNSCLNQAPSCEDVMCLVFTRYINGR